MQEVPCGLLRDPDVAVHPHAGDALEVRDEGVHGDCPHAVAQLAAVHDGARPEREHRLLRAVPAAVGHRLVLHALLDVERPAVGAESTVRPALLDEPLVGPLLRAEQIGDVEERQPLSIVFARCLHHYE